MTGAEIPTTRAATKTIAWLPPIVGRGAATRRRVFTAQSARRAQHIRGGNPVKEKRWN
jgi:hypothetical protein